MRLLIFSPALLLAWAAFGQSVAQVPAFDVADVHVSPRSSNPSIQPFDGSAYAANRMKGGFTSGGLYMLRTASMVDLIGAAYGVDADRVSSGPNWLDLDRFDVIAKAPADSTPETLKLMLKALLEERFKLAVQPEVKPLPAYVLTVGKRPQLKEASSSGNAGCRSVRQNTQKNAPAASVFTTYACHDMSMEAFAEALRTLASTYIGRIPILDRTGLQGRWDFDIHWTARDSLASAGSEGISFFDALDKQLGLKLERQQIPMPVIVVDQVNRRPTDNLPEVAKILPLRPAEFEVASVKPRGNESPEGGRVMPGGRIEMLGNTMKDFIKFAWNIDDNDDDTLVGGPKWLDVDRFDIVAKATTSQLPSGQLVDVDALRPMMKSLLVERFALRTHNEEAPIEVYALESAKRGLKLTKADPSRRTSCRNTVEMPGVGANTAPTVTRHFECHNTTMAQFSEVIRGLDGGYVDHPVIDGTGLEQAWDFELSFSPRRLFRQSVRGTDESSRAAGASDPTGAISLFQALDKQLGLQLKLQKRRMPVLVIDHVEQKPAEN